MGKEKKGGLHATASFSALSQGRRQVAPPSSEPERERATSKNRTSDRLEPFERTELLLSLKRAIFPRWEKPVLFWGWRRLTTKNFQNTPFTRVLCCLFCSPCFVLPWFVFDFLERLLWVNWAKHRFVFLWRLCYLVIVFGLLVYFFGCFWYAD